MKKVIYSAALALTLALTACNMEETYTPQEIVDQALQDTTEVKSYYGEYKMDMGEEGVSYIKEWVKDGKRRIELTGSNGEEYITINDGEKIVMLDVPANSIQIFEYEGDTAEYLAQQTPKQQADTLLELIGDTHKIEMKGEETVAGRKTYHIAAKADKENQMMGDMEVWIDKENWMTLKTISTGGGLTVTTEYTKVNMEPEIEDSLFVLDVPEGAVVEKMDADSYGPKESSTEEAKAALGSFLVFKEEEGVTLRSVEDMKVESRPEFAFNYNVNDEPAFTLSVLTSSEEAGDLGADIGAEKIKIRGVDGEQIDMKNFRYIQWTEGNLQYGVIVEDQEMPFEEVYRYIENMEIVQ